jgi:hypothetical protein
MPKRKKKNGITALTVPQAKRALKGKSTGACRMANGKSASYWLEAENSGDGRGHRATHGHVR